MFDFCHSTFQKSLSETRCFMNIFRNQHLKAPVLELIQNPLCGAWYRYLKCLTPFSKRLDFETFFSFKVAVLENSSGVGAIARDILRGDDCNFDFGKLP